MGIKERLIQLSRQSNKHLIPRLQEIKYKVPFLAPLIVDSLYKEILIKVAEEHYGGVYLSLNTTLDKKGKQTQDRFRYSALEIITYLRDVERLEVTLINEEESFNQSFQIIEVKWDPDRISLNNSSKVYPPNRMIDYTIYRVEVPSNVIQEEEGDYHYVKD